MGETKFPVAEKFKAPQGEGLYAGTPMAFIRLVGCSVGKRVCQACDTDFYGMYTHLGGGLFTVSELKEWARPYEHICLTGGEPLDRDIRPLIFGFTDGPVMVHIETSGTQCPGWLDIGHLRKMSRSVGRHMVAQPMPDGSQSWVDMPLWVTVSPKPGYLNEMTSGVADELKVILGGLGDGEGWPTLEDALLWSEIDGKLVYIQPRNDVLTINNVNMKEAIAVVSKYPHLRLSTQLHKYISTR